MEHQTGLNSVLPPPALMQTRADVENTSAQLPPAWSPSPVSSICVVQPTCGPQTFAFQCTELQCYGRSYKRWYEFERHYNGIHAAEKTVHWCPIPECHRSEGEGHRPFPRKHKMMDHAWKIHDIQEGDARLRQGEE
jgi:hypothetical protein